MTQSYWLTFRIHEDATSADRRAAIEQVVAEHAVGPIWDEPTSFIAFKSASPPGVIASEMRSRIDQLNDVLLLHPWNAGPILVVGKAERWDDLKAVLPNSLEYNR